VPCVIEDYAGHPFIVQLSRTLAARGREVHHLHSPSYGTVRADGLLTRDENLPSFYPVAVSLNEPVSKGAFVKRWRQEVAYGRLVVAELKRIGPKAVVTASTPLDAQALMLRYCRQARIPFVFWVQDFRGLAAADILAQRLRWPGRLIGAYYVSLERRLLRQSDALVLITEDFLGAPHMVGIPREKCVVVHNWACLNHVTPGPKVNDWSVKHGVSDRPCFMYSGTLGFKHNPGILLDLARRTAGANGAVVVVISEGPCMKWLRDEAAASGIDNMLLLDFQSMQDVPFALAAADVLIVLLESAAGAYCVPSKVLTYLCAGRPVLASIPRANLAARIVLDAGAGVVVPPGDANAFLTAATDLLANSPIRASMGRRAREYAQSHFEVDMIADRFEAVLTTASSTTPSRHLQRA
jgi:colanic acid biosynthesis glycosyl transferase WcaI